MPGMRLYLCVPFILREAATEEDVRLWREVWIIRPFSSHIMFQNVQSSVVFSQEQQVAILTGL